MFFFSKAKIDPIKRLQKYERIRKERGYERREDQQNTKGERILLQIDKTFLTLLVVVFPYINFSEISKFSSNF